MITIFQIVDFGDGYEQFYGDCYIMRHDAQEKCDKFNEDEYNNYGIVERKLY